MGNVTTTVLDHATTPEQREAWAKALDAENRRNGTAFIPAEPSVTLGGKVTEIHAGSANDHHRSYGVQTVTASPGLRPGHVVIGGVETTVEAAIAAGLMTREEAAQGFKQPVQSQAKAGTGDDKATKEASEVDREETASEAAQAAKEAGEVLDSLDQTLGAHVVDAALDEVIESGYLPEADELPEGADLGHVIKVMAGYVAQANSVLADAGASVPLLMETLDDEELRDARRATVKNDPDRMRELGRVAVDRLARMPELDPEGFAEMLEGMSPAERKCLTQNARGDWIVSIPDKPAMGFGAAVRMGFVRV